MNVSSTLTRLARELQAPPPSSPKVWSFTQVQESEIADLPSLEELLKTIDDRRFGSSHFRLYKDGYRVPADPLTSQPKYRESRYGFVASAELRDSLSAGHTVGVDHVELLVPGIKVLRDALSTALPAWVHVNAYLAGGTAQGLPTHSDTHDVIALQLAGRRDWRLFTQDGEVNLTLERGAALAMRRGLRHAAYHEDRKGRRDVSLHLAIGIVRPRVSHIVSSALRSMTERDPALNVEAPLSGTPEDMARFLEMCSQLASSWVQESSAHLDSSSLLALRREPWME